MSGRRRRLRLEPGEVVETLKGTQFCRWVCSDGSPYDRSLVRTANSRQGNEGCASTSHSVSAVRRRENRSALLCTAEQLAHSPPSVSQIDAPDRGNAFISVRDFLNHQKAFSLERIDRSAFPSAEPLRCARTLDQRNENALLS